MSFKTCHWEKKSTSNKPILRLLMSLGSLRLKYKSSRAEQLNPRSKHAVVSKSKDGLANKKNLAATNSNRSHVHVLLKRLQRLSKLTKNGKLSKKSK